MKTLTPTELLKLINNATTKHERIKEEMKQALIIIDQQESIYNKKGDELKEIEESYIILIDELNSRNNG